LPAPGSVSIRSLHVDLDLQQHVTWRPLGACEADRTEHALGIELVDNGNHRDVASLAVMPTSVRNDAARTAPSVTQRVRFTCSPLERWRRPH
jgi:hypothetical protein